MSRGKFSRPYTYLFHDGIRRILNHPDLTRTDLRVFLAAIATAPVDTREWDTDPTGIATRSHTSESEVYKSLRRLEAADLIRRPRRGKLAHNPDITWRGTAEDAVLTRLRSKGILQ